MSYNTYPQNPFPPNSENAGGGSLYVLPIASAETLGGVKVGAGLSIASGVLSVDRQTVDYSTTEQNTGLKWIDGKDIFVKTVDFGALPNNATKKVSSELSNVTVIKIEAIAQGNSVVALPYVSANTSNKVEITIESNGDISISSNADFSANNGFITLYYTKVTV